MQASLTLAVGQAATMSSLEISELTGSRHDKVKQSIERLAAKGVIAQPPTGIEQAPDSMGRMRATEVYLFTGDKGRRHVLASGGYNARPAGQNIGTGTADNFGSRPWYGQFAQQFGARRHQPSFRLPSIETRVD